MGIRAWGDECRLTTVCIDSCENSVLQGRFYNSYFKEGRSFQSSIQFLNEMEKALDSMDFPKAFTTTRTFVPLQSHETEPPTNGPPVGQAGTFAIRILFRQNASWQGSITWLEGRQEQSFRSVLELLLLIDNALNKANEKVS